MNPNISEITSETAPAPEKKAPKTVSLKLLSLLLAAAIIVSSLVSVLITNSSLKRKYDKQLNDVIALALDDTYYTLDRVKQLFAADYLGDLSGLTDDQITDALIRMYIALTGDEYAFYWNKEEYALYNQSQQGHEVGIGVVISVDTDGALSIIYIHRESPAEKAGLLVGDRIVAVEDARISEMEYNDVVSKIKGEVGTEVDLTVEREGEETVIKVKRDRYTSDSVVSRMLSDSKTAYIRILEFDGTTVEQFAKAYLELENNGAEAFVFDVRGNPGGALSSVMGVLSFLLGDDIPLIEISDSEGVIIQNSSRATYCTDDYSKQKTTVHDKKTVILTDGGTASAGELFTAVMNGKYVTVGDKTFGKGTMQNIYQLPNGGALKLTFAKYSAPGVPDYNGEGITPDVQQSLGDDVKDKNIFTLTEEQDTQLQKALEVLAEPTNETN
ncbi:MAG: PDZ domain-containing protein [Ruminococcaceae bacterium]|nr:PDZ domain-containing protein [Oscillospiraceae bacterium]